MKELLFAVILLASQGIMAQTDPSFEPVFIIGQEVVSMEQVEAYARQGYIKSMQNGVSEEQFQQLKKVHGEQLLAKEFVVLVQLLSEAERKAKQREARPADPRPENGRAEDGLRKKAGDRAPDFEVRMVDGEIVRLSDLRGKVILLNFWATWCAPCIREFYEIPDKILDEFEEEDLVFLPIARGEEEAVVRKKLQALAKKGLAFRSGVDPEEMIWDQFATGALPKNFIIDRAGRIVYAASGNDGSSVDALQGALRKLFQD